MGISRTGVLAGIKQQRFPLERGKFLRNTRGDDAVQVRVQRGHARGNREMELIQVHVIAPPCKGLAVGSEHHARDLFHRAVGHVSAGNPLRRGQRQRARRHRQVDIGVKQLARRIAKIGGDLDGRLLRAGHGQRKELINSRAKPAWKVCVGNGAWAVLLSDQGSAQRPDPGRFLPGRTHRVVAHRGMGARARCLCSVSAVSLYHPYTIRQPSFYAVHEPTHIGELQLRRGLTPQFPTIKENHAKVQT